MTAVDCTGVCGGATRSPSGQQKLRRRFVGTVLDGWIDPSSIHYVTQTRVVYHLMAPLLDGRTWANWDEHIKLIDATLDWYKKSRENVLVIAADNTNLNPYFARNIMMTRRPMPVCHISQDCQTDKEVCPPI
jgi:hypothetical protein